MLQKNIVNRKDLAEWEREYGGTTAEGIAKRVINQYSPSSEELSRTVNRGRGAGKKTDGTTEVNENMSIDVVARNGGEDGPVTELPQGSSCCKLIAFYDLHVCMNTISESCIDFVFISGRSGNNWSDHILHCAEVFVR